MTEPSGDDAAPTPDAEAAEADAGAPSESAQDYLAALGEAQVAGAGRGRVRLPRPSSRRWGMDPEQRLRVMEACNQADAQEPKSKTDQICIEPARYPTNAQLKVLTAATVATAKISTPT